MSSLPTDRTPTLPTPAARLLGLPVDERTEAERRARARRNRRASADLARSLRALLRDQRPPR